MKRQHPWIAVLALAGCAAVGPDYRAPVVALPDRYAADTAQAAQPSDATLARWWRELRDPQLDALVDEALAANLDLELARARLRQARAARSLAAASLYPAVGASAGASRHPGGDAPGTLFEAGFDASWELDLFGGTRRAVEAATADVAASEASLAQARASLVAEVARNYIDVRAAQRRLAIARDNLASQTETLQITDWRRQAGLARQSEVEQARASREQTRALVPDLQSAQAAAEHRLAVLLGRHPAALRAQLAAPRALPALPASVATGIPADVLRRRPDLAAAERRLAAETARVGQRMAERFPSLRLGGSLGWQAYRVAELGSSATVARTLAGTLAATLFDGGRLRSQVEVQSAVQEQALIDYRRSVLVALEEVENALRAYAAGRERAEARDAAAQAAQAAAQLSRDLYQAGLQDFQPVLDSERTRLAAEDALATAEAEQRIRFITLYKALGGGS